MPVERLPERDGDLPVLITDETIHFTLPQTKLYIDNHLEGQGIFHVTTKRAIWLSSDASTVGYAIDYPFITVHAILRDKSSFPEQCLYCQLRTEDLVDEDGEEEEAPLPELHFAPADPSRLQELFVAFSQMSALNPDPADEQADESSSGSDGSDIGEPCRVWVADDNDAAMEDVEDDDEML
uniref:Methylosome subunit pICln n=1 Tax=Noctiluca scintillans TaxID=2966 RepID=A0A7S1AZB1_NOCSC